MRTFAAYLGNEGSTNAPGRAVRPDDDAPAWVRAGSDRRLIASAAGRSLFAVREAGGMIGFALGDGVGISDSERGWKQQFADHAIVVLGPESSDPSSPTRALFGVVAKSVDRVELRYSSGSATVASARHGGFVLIADRRREPETVVAFDAGSRARPREAGLHRLVSRGRARAAGPPHPRSRR